MDGKGLVLPTEVLNRKYSPRSIGATAPTPFNGRCSLSPCGAHYWKIEPPGEAASLGVCWYCGEEREFYNRVTLEFKR